MRFAQHPAPLRLRRVALPEGRDEIGAASGMLIEERQRNNPGGENAMTTNHGSPADHSAMAPTAIPEQPKAASLAPSAELEQLVAEADTGGRKPTGAVATLISAVAIAWSLFQLWYASPLPFAFGFGILNDTEARSIHLAFGLFLAYTAYPAFKRSPRAYVPAVDWVLAVLGAFAGAYLFLFYRELATRPGTPTTFDLVTAGAGILLLLEATRRSLGLPMVIVAGAFIAYTFLGPYMPDVLQHKGASMAKFLQHQWLTTEGVFVIALGVSTSFVFLFVLFGTLLDKAGAGNWMMQISIALLGHLRGGPAKVAVVSSALNGVVSGSSVSNVVSGGIFDQRTDYAARYGCGGLPDGGICRHSLRRYRQARLPAGGRFLFGAPLHRSS